MVVMMHGDDDDDGALLLASSSSSSRVSELPLPRPLPRNAQKRTNKKNRHARTFFCELAQMYVVFLFFSPATP
jgi:hypothetical protein